MTLLEEAGLLLKQYESEPPHVQHVAHLSDELFVGLQPLHGYDEPERSWLFTAALLHDIGWSQTTSGKGHHKHSMRLILEHPWKSLSPETVAVVANIARYHRKSLPASHHDLYQALDSANQKKVDVLGGILRIADALDRTHAARVRHVTASLKDPITLTLESNGPVPEEVNMFHRKKDLLEKALGQAMRLT